MTSPETAITTDPALSDDRDESLSVFVETTEIDAAAEALTPATPRLALVTFDGTEYESEDAWLEADNMPGMTDYQTMNANYIHDVQRRPGGAYVVLDTKGVAPSAMGVTMVRVVTEELKRLGVTVAHPTGPST